MKSISLKLKDQILRDLDALLEHLNSSRNNYINEAIEFYNQYQQRRLIEEKLAHESKLIQDDSLETLHEFEQLEDEI